MQAFQDPFADTGPELVAEGRCSPFWLQFTGQRINLLFEAGNLAERFQELVGRQVPDGGGADLFEQPPHYAAAFTYDCVVAMAAAAAAVDSSDAPQLLYAALRNLSFAGASVMNFSSRMIFPYLRSRQVTDERVDGPGDRSALLF